MSEKITTGKLPPQAVDLEEAVLGAMLIDTRGMDTVFEVINSPDVFYKSGHQWIFKAAQSLYKRSEAIDMLTVSEELKSFNKLADAGGQRHLVELTERIASSAHTEYHCRILLQKYLQRQVIKIASEAIEDAYSDKCDALQLLDDTSAKFDLLQGVVSSGYTSQDWSGAVLSIPARVEFLTNNEGEITGVPSGLKNVDQFTNGWQPGEFIVIGADSGMGKTALVMGMILASAKNGKPAGMFSMEMPVVQLAARGVAVESNFHMKQLTHYGFEKQEYFQSLNRVVDRLSKLPIHIDDKPALTIQEMKRKARTMYRKHGIEFIVIDFIQMFSGDSNDIRINVGDAARECKNLAKELNIPVIALSQLSREVKKVQYCIPQKHHLKESSAIEEAADLIALLYRPSYYGYSESTHPALFDQLEMKHNENACLIIAKNRSGAMGTIGLHFIENKTKYVNPEDVQGQPVEVQDDGLAF